MSKSELLKRLTSLKNQEGLLVCDSLKVSQKVLLSKKFKPLEIYYEEGLSIDPKIIEGFPSSKSLTREEFIQIKGQKFHKGLITIFEDKTINDLSSFDEIQGPFVVLNGVTSPENVGAIIRTIAGLGFKSLVVDDKTCHPHNRRIVRVSMGNFVFLNLYRSKNLINDLKSTSRKIYAAANDVNAISISDWKPEKESGFIIGSEGHGIDLEVKESCTDTIKIPINEKVQHLNAGHACAIIAAKYLS